MSGAKSNLRYLLWLALGTLVMALAMASLLAFELAQKRALEQRAALQADSLTALVFQFEREFLRLRHAIEIGVAGSGPLDTETLTLRYDIFLSRIALLRDNQSIELLSQRPEYRSVMPRLNALVALLDQTLGAKALRRADLVPVLRSLVNIGQDVQAMTLAANSEIARLVERQNQALLEQNALIVKLSIAQLLMLVLGAAALGLRHRRQEAERQALEQLTNDLQEARGRAEAANREKSRFLANMSHELRTPFNGLMGMLGLLAETPVSTQQAEYLDTAQVSAQHLLTLLNDILDVTAMEAGKLTLQPAPVHLPALLQEVRALLEPQARAKGLKFAVHAPDLTAHWLLADAVRLKQILFNLIGNAIKFTDQGQLVLHVAQRSDAVLGLVTLLEVVDTGIGMAASDVEQLFRRFVQLDNSVTRKFGGTGLGLEISQSLARMMRGQITVRSELGKGSCFTLSVPLPVCVGANPSANASFNAGMEAQIEARKEAEKEAILTESTTGPSADSTAASDAVSVALSPLAAPRVLVVDDHPINQKLAGAVLSRLGCSVVMAENGQLAVQLVQHNAYDLILMDVNMPVMDGLTATRQIRALSGAVARTPVVVFTADVMNGAEEQARAAGADDFLSKPVKIEQLRAVLQKHCQGCVNEKLDIA